jgi:hypothetical protein
VNLSGVWDKERGKKEEGRRKGEVVSLHLVQVEEGKGKWMEMIKRNGRYHENWIGK